MLTSLFRFIDHLVFGFICAASIWMPFRRKDHIMLICSFVILAVLCLLIWIDKRNARKMIDQQLKAAAETICIERLLLKEDQEIQTALHEQSLYFIRKTVPDMSDILAAVRSGKECILLVGAPEEFVQTVRLHAPQKRLVDARKCFDAVGISCTEAEANERLYASVKQRKKRTAKGFIPIRSKLRFLMLGTLLLVLSFVFGHKIYYRLLSSVCFIMHIVSVFFRLQKKERFS